MTRIHIFAFLALLAGWHIDYRDAELVEQNKHRLESSTNEQALIDNHKHGGCQ